MSRSLQKNFVLSTVTLVAALLAGCSSGSMASNNPTPTAKTNVVVVLTSTANDQLVNFYTAINSIMLADKAGNTVPLYFNPNPQSLTTANVEFMHLNGISEPIATASVPEGVYTSAIVRVGSCSFTTVSLTANGGVLQATDAQGVCDQGTGMTTVNLASPITISGSTMALSLSLQVSQSYTLSPNGNPPPGYSFSHTFTLAPLVLASQPTTEQNGKFVGINGLITSIHAGNNSFVAQIPDGFSLTVNSSSNTTYQGVAAFSTLTVGTLVNMDLAIQSDSSLLAGRIEVDNLAVPMNSIGPLIGLSAQPGSFLTLPGQAEGCTLVGTPFCGSVFQYDANTTFGFSSEFTNLRDLPFSPSLTGPNLLFGQRLSLFASGQFNAVNLQPVSSIILAPQIINGTVTAVSTDHNFTVYNVLLAPYHIIPALQGVVGPINRLTGPVNVVQVYVDSSAQVSTSAPINPGSLLRFRGLIFDDNGVLRMDCNLIRDGVPE